MSKRYWGYIAAIGLTLAAHHPEAEAKAQQGEREERVANAIDDIATLYRQQTERLESAPESQPCEPGDDKRDSDLCAQWKAADAAASAAWWASVGTWVSSISGFFVVIALFLAFQSNRIARASAQAQLRPYVHADGVGWALRVNGGDTFLDMKVQFRNAGQTPAKNVRMGAVAYFTKPDEAPPNVNMMVDVSTEKQPLGPASCVSVTVISPLIEADATEVWAGKKNLFVVGVATYEDPFSKVERKTTCHYKITLGKADGAFTYLWWNHVGGFNDAT